MKVSLKFPDGNSGVCFLGILLSSIVFQWDLAQDGLNIYYYTAHMGKIPSSLSCQTLLVRSLGGGGGRTLSEQVCV